MNATSRLNLVLVALLFCSATALLGQGNITVLGNPPTRITDATTGQLVGSGYLAALYWAPVGASRDQFVQLGGAQTVVNGILPQSGGTFALPVSSPGESVQLLGAAWEAAFGGSYEAARQVVGAKVGESTIVTTPTGLPGQPVQVRIPDFSVSPVPEPSTLALVALGVGSLLLWRRR
jgi:hypothetical protein